MKIGILTFCCAYNYGAILQCYALQEFLRESGFDVEVLNYRPSYLETKKPKIFFTSFFTSPIRFFYYLLRVFPRFSRSYSKFQQFCDYNLLVTEKLIEVNHLTKKSELYDYILIGSDQIWNDKFNGRDKNWYGEFVCKDSKTKLLSYAASAGNANFSEEKKEYLKHALSAFYALSARESILKNKLQELLKKEVSLVLDPTLMTNQVIWEKWYTPIREDRYVLVYQARENNNCYRIAEHISKELNANVLGIDNCSNTIKRYGSSCIYGPSDFVSLIKNALCVITTSFHGTAFSIITNVPFYTLALNDGADERSASLLESLGLSERMIDKDSTPKFHLIDYSFVNFRLNDLRKKSQDFLKQNIR